MNTSPPSVPLVLEEVPYFRYQFEAKRDKEVVVQVIFVPDETYELQKKFSRFKKTARQLRKHGQKLESLPKLRKQDSDFHVKFAERAILAVQVKALSEELDDAFAQLRHCAHAHILSACRSDGSIQVLEINAEDELIPIERRRLPELVSYLPRFKLASVEPNTGEIKNKSPSV